MITNYSMVIDMIDAAYSRDNLRRIAKAHGIRCGKNKRDTISNILNSFKFEYRLILFSKEKYNYTQPDFIVN